MRTRKPVRLGLLSLMACLAGCSTSSESFVEDQPGFSVTRGRIMQVENLHAEKIEPLADGVAVWVSRPGCVVSLRFENDAAKEFEVGPGVILVHGYDRDFVLTSEMAAAPSR